MNDSESLEAFSAALFEFLSRFTGRDGIEEGVVRFGLAALFWGALFGHALWRHRHAAVSGEKLFVWAFGIGLARDLLMLGLAFLSALGVAGPALHAALALPLHAFTDLAMVTVAGAFLHYLLPATCRADRYLPTAAGAIALVHLLALPLRESGLWEWLVRANSCILLFAAFFLVRRYSPWRLRHVASLAFFCFLLRDFLRLLDLALGERYHDLLSPARFGSYLLAIILLGYVYLREQARERERAERALREKTRLLQTILDAIPAPTYYKDAEGFYLGCNTAFEKFLGLPRERIVGSTVFGVAPEALARIYHQADLSLMQLGGAQTYETQVEGAHGRSDVIFHKAVFHYDDGTAAGLVGTMLDISARKRAEESVRELAFFDPLTKLPNRSLFRDRLQQAIAHCERDGHRAAVLFLDLDRFKDVNDGFGHSAGDLLLKAIADRLSGTLRESDTLARFGGDEFVYLLATVSGERGAAVVAEKILSQMAVPFLVGGQEIFLTASIGIALFPEDGGDPEALLKHADMAMYAAKEQGKNTFQFFSQEMHRQAVERHELAISLRRALQEPGQLFLAYQPQIELATGRIVGIEALLRWNHPELGSVSPLRFIPVAEETGLIRPLGEWVLRAACAQNRAWQDAGMAPLPVGVNLSGGQLRQPGLAERVMAILAETGLPPECLELELTESILMEAAEETTFTLSRLRTLGIRLSIDDFGTGYSSLAYLKHFPIERIKIDRSFVHDLTINGDDAAIIESIIAMARGLNLRVIAEGVETPEQLEFLRDRQCHEMQGFLVAEPLAPEEFFRRFSGAVRSEA